jgi:hypothetical protein
MGKQEGGQRNLHSLVNLCLYRVHSKNKWHTAQIIGQLHAIKVKTAIIFILPLGKQQNSL